MEQSLTGFHHLPDQGPVPDRSDIHLSAEARSRHNYFAPRTLYKVCREAGLILKQELNEDFQ